MDIFVPRDFVSRLVYKVVAAATVGAAYALACNLGTLPMPGGVA